MAKRRRESAASSRPVPEFGEAGRGRGASIPWRAILAAAAIFLAPLVLQISAYDAFEIPKRTVWILLGFLLLPRVRFGKEAFAGGLLILYLVATTFCFQGRDANLLALIIWILPPLLILLAAGHRWGERDRNLIGKTLLLTGFVQAILMLLQRFGLDPLFGETTSALAYLPSRMIGTVGYHNQAAELLGLSLTGLFWARWRHRAIGVALALLIVIALFLTLNRGAILALLVATSIVGVVWFLWKGRTARHVFLAFILLGGGAIVFLLLPGGRARATELLRPERSPAIQTRLWMAKVAVHQFCEHPFLGKGAGSYARDYMEGLREILPEKKDHRHLPYLVYAQEAHDDPLQFLAEFGLAGSVLLVLFLFAIARSKGRRLLRKERFGPVLYLIGFMGTVSLFSFSWQTPLAGPLAALLLGIAIADDERADDTSRRDVICRWLALLALLSMAFVQWTEMAFNGRYGAGKTIETPFREGLARGKWLAQEGTAFEKAGDSVRAERLLRRAVRLEESPASLSNLGAVLVQEGKLGEAEAVYDHWARCGLLHSEALRNLSLVAERKGETGRCSELEALRFSLFPTDFSDADLFRSAVCHLRAGEFEQGLHLAALFRDKCMRHQKDSWTPEWENLRGVFLMKTGRLDEARRSFELALERKPGLVSARKNLEALGKEP